MTEFSVIVKNNAGQPIQDAQVTVNGDFPQFTDKDGFTHYSINEWNIQLRIVATKGISSTEGTISVDVFGIARPDVLNLILHTDLTAPLKQPLATLGEMFRGSWWLLGIAVIVGVGVAVFFVYRGFTSGKVTKALSGVASTVKEKVEGAVETVKEKVEGDEKK